MEHRKINNIHDQQQNNWEIKQGFFEELLCERGREYEYIAGILLKKFKLLLRYNYEIFLFYI